MTDAGTIEPSIYMEGHIQKKSTKKRQSWQWMDRELLKPHSCAYRTGNPKDCAVKSN